LIRAFLTFLYVIVLTCASRPGYASPDDLDPSFGNGGKLIVGPGTTGASRVVLPQADGGFIVFTPDIWRLKADGTPDTAFGSGSGRIYSAPLCDAFVSIGCQVASIATQPDGKILVAFAVQTNDGNGPSFGVARLLQDGTVDSAFGNNGTSRVPSSPLATDSAAGILVQSNGGIIVGGTSYDSSGFAHFAIARFLPSGAPDLTFGVEGRSIAQLPAEVVAAVLAQQQDGKLLVVGGPRAGSASTLLVRFLANGQPDPTFANLGVYRDDLSPAMDPTAIAVQPDGKIVIAGSVELNGVSQLALLRLDIDGNRDSSFGAAGQVVLQLDENNRSEAAAVALDSHQRIVVVGTLSDELYFFYNAPSLPMLRIGVARFNADGSPDLFFGPHGATAFWSGFSSSGTAIVVEPADTILVGGTIERQAQAVASFFGGLYERQPEAALFRLQGGEGTVAKLLREEHAIEYYYAGFGHYFVSATPIEIAWLDAFLSGWVRTGESFRVWKESAPGLNSVCRFFSDQSFAPKSSHFYTPYPVECAALKSGTVWKFEGNAFELQLPLGVSGQGTCPTGSVPLYRLYNNGQGGAPNHRYTDDLAIFNQMLAQGWIFEGEAQTKVFACAPAP
jgi:uncharacterized delta-60 repeat protein